VLRPFARNWHKSTAKASKTVANNFVNEIVLGPREAALGEKTIALGASFHKTFDARLDASVINPGVLFGVFL